MGMTMTQKIMAKHAGLTEVQAGQLITMDLDLVMANDITGPVSVLEYEKGGFQQVSDASRIALVMDHFAPNKDIKSAENCKVCRTFAKRFGIKHFYDTGKAGIEHALLPEQGLVASGEAIVGADSHTCTYGALRAFSTGVGSTDVTAAMVTGKLWFKVPSAIRFYLTGALPKYVSGKDLILHIIGMIGVDGALYKSMEFAGPGVTSLTMDDRLTICNMAIEAGAKNGIFPVDDITRAYEEGRVDRPYNVYTADSDAEYEKTIEIDLSTLKPTVSFPHLPSNTRTFEEIPDIPIDQVVIGSCTNGRMSDMKAAAEILSGRHVSENVRTIVIPATQAIYLECLEKGYIKTFIEAGCAVSTPTCGPCLGGYMGVLAAGERCVSTTNRNFIGRMGDKRSEVYLASPATAAASAIAGKIASAETVIG